MADEEIYPGNAEAMKRMETSKLYPSQADVDDAVTGHQAGTKTEPAKMAEAKKEESVATKEMAADEPADYKTRTVTAAHRGKK